MQAPGSMSADNSLRASIRSGRSLIGAWFQLDSPMAAEITARLGFDWVGIDSQHGLIGFDGMLRMLQAIAIGGVPAIVRVAANDPDLIGQALDCGAAGVIVPLVESPEQAEAAVAACRFPPHGRRSWGPVRPALVEGYAPADAEREVVCIPLIETAKGVEAIEEIAAVDHLDAVFVGPADLGLSLGGSPGSSLVDPLIAPHAERIFLACTAHELAVGAVPPGSEHVCAYLAAGCQIVPAYRDVQGLKEAASAALTAARITVGVTDHSVRTASRPT